MKNFWLDLKKPILALAPMADVTDSAFRHIISKNSDIPHITYTEFVSADGLARAPEEGKRKLLKDLEYSEIERPIVAQFFTSNQEHMRQAAALALELGFDGVDINMGCPDKSIEKQGAGAALIKNPKLARELIRAAKEGVQNKIPVSIKTRIGYNQNELETWLPELLAEEPAAIILHLRTRKEMSKVAAHWELLETGFLKSLGNPVSKCLILGNGDIENVEEAFEKIKETGLDGIMLGRAVFGNPFLFRKNPPTLEEKIRALKEHIELFDKNLGTTKSFAIMKKNFKSYLSGFENISELKEKLMSSESAEGAIGILDDYLL